MIELLEFAFRDAWTFAGCVALLFLAGVILSALLSAVSQARPFQGIVQVNAPTESRYTDNRQRYRSTTIKPADVRMHATLEAEQDALQGDQFQERNVHQSGMSNSCWEPRASVKS